MRLQHPTEARGRPSRWTAALGVAALMASLAACSSGPEGIVVNLYGGASGTGFDKIIADCNQAAAGRYTIVGNLLPSDADGQRDQFVRRLAAHDDGMDLLGMDVTWTAEFAEAGWIRELTGDQKAQATKDTLQPPIDTATWKDKLYGIPAHHQRPTAVVPQVPGAHPAQDVRRDDLDGPAAQGPGQALRDRHDRGPVRGLRRQHQQPGHRVRRHAGQRGQHGAHHRRQDRAGAGPDASSSPRPASPARPSPTPRSPRSSPTCRTGDSAFSLNWPYVLSAMREANPDLVSDLGFAPYPSVDRRARRR